MDTTAKPNEPERDKSTNSESEKMIDLMQTLIFTFVTVLVIFRIIGCCELYNLIESRR